MSAGHVTIVFDGDCMANTIFPVGLNKTLQKKSNVAMYQVVAKPPNVVVCLLILIQYVRQQIMLL